MKNFIFCAVFRVNIILHGIFGCRFWKYKKDRINSPRKQMHPNIFLDRAENVKFGRKNIYISFQKYAYWS